MASFGEAIYFLKSGKQMYRRGWNGKNLVVYLYYPDVDTLTDEQLEENTMVNYHYRIWNKSTKVVDAWVPSISDIQAIDWEIY